MPTPPISLELLALGLALALDLLLREPSNAFHPVAWMGMPIAMIRRRASRKGRWIPFCTGAVFVLCGTAVVAGLAVALHLIIRQLPFGMAIVAEAIALKSTFSVGALVRAGRSVQGALQEGEVAEARRRLSWHLVSRDTSQLSDSEVAAATVESLAENASDSLVSPLLFYAVAGLPGALVYRFVNTCDAMLGYRTGELEWLGKAAARLDDLMNWVPARLSALVLILAGALLGYSPRRAITVWWRDRGGTSSPNAGHPMSAMAGLLGVELEKRGEYRLGRGQRAPQSCDIGLAVRVLYATAAVAAIALSIPLAMQAR